jgi:pilus assembly protein CpaF
MRLGAAPLAAKPAVLGVPALDALLADDRVTEIMVNGPSDVWVERDGKLSPTDVRFADATEVLALIDRIVTPLGRRCDARTPMVDARLADGSRVHAIVPPLCLNGPTVTIRKFPRLPLTAADLVRRGSASAELMAFLRACVLGRVNIVVSGGTSTGKTTLLNVLSSNIPDDERIITIENAAELRLQQRHVIILE